MVCTTCIVDRNALIDNNRIESGTDLAQVNTAEPVNPKHFHHERVNEPLANFSIGQVGRNAQQIATEIGRHCRMHTRVLRRLI